MKGWTGHAGWYGFTAKIRFAWAKISGYVCLQWLFWPQNWTLGAEVTRTCWETQEPPGSGQFRRSMVTYALKSGLIFLLFDAEIAFSEGKNG